MGAAGASLSFPSMPRAIFLSLPRQIRSALLRSTGLLSASKLLRATAHPGLPSQRTEWAAFFANGLRAVLAPGVGRLRRCGRGVVAAPGIHPQLVSVLFRSDVDRSIAAIALKGSRSI